MASFERWFGGAGEGDGGSVRGGWGVRERWFGGACGEVGEVGCGGWRACVQDVERWFVALLVCVWPRRRTVDDVQSTNSSSLARAPFVCLDGLL